MCGVPFALLPFSAVVDVSIHTAPLPDKGLILGKPSIVLVLVPGALAAALHVIVVVVVIVAEAVVADIVDKVVVAATIRTTMVPVVVAADVARLRRLG